MNKRLVELDSLRGIAALMVVGYHYTTRFQKLYGHPGGPPFAVPWGMHGVSLFFLISGFVIFMTLERTRDWRDFLVSRFARLYPAYWASVLLTAVVVTLGALPHKATTLPWVLVNLTMLQEWLNVPHVDGVYWTLTFELSFYAIMLALYALRLLEKIEWVAVLWMCAMLADFFLERRGVLALPPLLGTTLLLGCANLFMAGVMFYRLHRAQRPRAAVALIAAALALQFVIYGRTIGLICACFFALFALILRNVRWLCVILSARPLVYLGTISYSLYLLHQYIGYVILRALYARAVAPAVAIAVTLATVVLLAAGVNALIETPARTAIRSWWRAYRHRTHPGPA